MRLRYLWFLLLVGCGDFNDDAKEKPAIGLDAECPVLNTRFDSCTAAKLYSSDYRTGEANKKLPVSKAPQWRAWKFRDAPEAFKKEWKSGGVAGEVIGYVNLLGDRSSTKTTGLLEKGSRFTFIRDGQGKAVFKDAFSAGPSWARIPDDSDGRVSAGGESHPMVLSLLVADKFTLELRMIMQISEENGAIKGYLYNKESVKVPLIGVIADPYGLQFKMEFYPWQDGLLAYTSSVATVKKFEDQFTPESVGQLASSLFRWYVSELTNNSGIVTQPASATDSVAETQQSFF